MHYFKKNIGDYHKKAGRLSMLQHGALNLLMDSCYDRERFPTRDEAIDWLWASSKEEIEAIDFVLAKFFTLEGTLYVQNRISEEIQEYSAVCQSNAINGKKGGRPKGSKNKPKETHSVNLETHSVNLKSEVKANESEVAQIKTLTTNQEPLTTNQEPIELPLSSGDDAPKVKKIPYEAIKEIYNEQLPTLTGSRVLSDKSKRQIAAIWKQDGKHQGREFWTAYFSGCGQLSGKMENWTGVSTGNKCGTIELLTRNEIFVRNINEIIDAGIWA
jgi:uncharacterized protein YdaU (DUF1376 family)